MMKNLRNKIVNYINSISEKNIEREQFFYNISVFFDKIKEELNNGNSLDSFVSKYVLILIFYRYLYLVAYFISKMMIWATIFGLMFDNLNLFFGSNLINFAVAIGTTMIKNGIYNSMKNHFESVIKKDEK